MGNILLDQKEIWTSPFHMRKRNAKWWISFGALGAALIVTDHQTSTLLENSRGQVQWGNRLSKIGAAYTLLPLMGGHTKLAPIIACALAGVVTASRFTAQQHYASDLLTGGAMGWFLGRYVWKTHQDHALHPHSKIHAGILPEFDPASRTYGVALTLSK